MFRSDDILGMNEIEWKNSSKSWVVVVVSLIESME